jgi:hypothetical protein
MKCTLLQWQTMYKDISGLIVQASSYIDDKHDMWQPFPIGMSWAFSHHAHLKHSLQIGIHSATVLSAIRSSTDSYRRGSMTINRSKIIDTLSRNGIQNHELHHEHYFTFLPSYKFVISPEGNGIDCHRHYEALLAGCIPIIEHNPLIEEKYKGCPILYTTDYSEITEEYLQQKYEEMLHKEYDFSRLFLSFYSNEEQKLIKHCGNYWLGQNRLPAWYS